MWGIFNKNKYCQKHKNMILLWHEQKESELISLKLYHGSTFIVDKPSLEILNYRTDFGKGFYTTTDIEQAKNWTLIKKKRLEKEGKNININQYVNVYEYTENEKLSILNFEEATEEWLKFVFKNRESDELVHKYDIVIGPVADDSLYQVLVGYETGMYDTQETIKRLKTYQLVNQISFHTLKSLECIKYIETIKVGGENE